MNRLTAALILLLISISVSVSGYFYIVKSADEIISVISEDRKLTLESGNISPERAERIQKIWKEKETFLVAILPHEELDEIEMSIKKLPYYQQQNFAEEYIKALNDCTSRLEHISESEKLDFKSLF